MVEGASSPAEIFARVLKGLMRPLVKAMIAHGLTAPAVYRLLKEVFVEVAERDFALDGKSPTDSRISVLTGVHRKDVRAIREAGPDDGANLRDRVTAMASVIGRWLADPETTDAEGRPLALPRQAAEGPSFERLAMSVSTDIRPRTVLDELLRQRLVVADQETGLLRLDSGAFIGPAETQQKIHFFSQNVGDHIAAATANLLAEESETPFIERAVFYNRLTPASVDALEAEARRLGADALTRLNRDAFRRQAADQERDDADERFRFGVFFYRAKEEPVEPRGGRAAGGTDEDPIERTTEADDDGTE